MPLATADLVCFVSAQFKEVACCLGFAHEINRLVIMFQNRPVRVVFAHRCVNDKPLREFDEELDILILI